jgi:di/tricarboxylate transporter
MSTELLLVLALLAAAVAMFARNHPRSDVVALLMIAALPLTGAIDTTEALAGFADPNVVLIALLFVVGEGLARTGVARRMGDWLVQRAGTSETRLIVLLMVLVTTIGSVMSSTGVVAIFIPIVLRIARNTGIPASQLFMPLSVAALVSGMMTLVGTPPNLVVHGELVRSGHPGFGFFSFTPFGVPMLALAIGYMLLARRWLRRPAVDATPAADARPRMSAWIEAYALAGREHRLRVTPGSALAGRTLQALDLRASDGINVLAIERHERFGRQLLQPSASTRLQAGDILFLDVFDPRRDLATLAERHALRPLPLSGSYFADLSEDIGMAELIIPAHSALIGKSVVEARIRSVHDLAVIGLKRHSEAVTTRLAETPLRLGDTLLVVGPWRALRKLATAGTDLVAMTLPAEFDEVVPAAPRAGAALASLALMVVLMTTGIVPNVQAALITCLLVGLFGCIDMNSAYRSIHWQTLVLIVGMLPFSLALQRTGGVDLAAGGLLAVIGDSNPRVALAALFGLTAVLGMFVSNTATAVLMAPVSLAIASALGASPYPFAMTVALAASASFMTPVSSPVNTLVVGPGGYRFNDFVRIGVPLTLLAGLACVTLVPWLLPP